ncbi:hypothetical protein BDK51DRAFT_42951 [Blyttiomyces helicus]|uniref:Fe2OG dioxygenase domain-containing protein n=1 Tax=Blyttiomyces helicus TaxID=388810 RepID=A0A4P9WP42_9FUNG|nr:hypothetical protein BDK51DRAFT_42951 [Blyttiomyces helicus]|eukprot:RKO92990.1 hypothetical protein BDK51DRAFT_42951 [Blyttiomyces helicus]
MTATDNDIAVIDIRALMLGSSAKGARAASSLCRALEATGFVQVVGHGIDVGERERFLAASRAFLEDRAARELCRRSAATTRGFADDELTGQKRDGKLLFDFANEALDGARVDVFDDSFREGPNQWPVGKVHTDLRPACLAYFASLYRLSTILLDAIFAELGIDSEVVDVGDQHSSFMRVNYYPIAADHKSVGVHAHTDAGLLTLLWQQSGVEGLQVLRENEWVPIPPIDDALVVNVGDMLQVIVNDRLRAPRHRVVLQPSTTHSYRLSSPFFLAPTYGTVCRPAPVMPLYRPILWADFRAKRVAGDYTDLGTEIQIDQYRMD